MGIILFYISFKLRPLKINKRVEETAFKCLYSYNDETIAKNKRPTSLYKKYFLISNNNTIAKTFLDSSKLGEGRIVEDEYNLKKENEYRI